MIMHTSNSKSAKDVSMAISATLYIEMADRGR